MVIYQTLMIQLPSYTKWNTEALQISNKRTLWQSNQSTIPYVHMHIHMYIIGICTSSAAQASACLTE